jgi:hypothetical protein
VTGREREHYCAQQRAAGATSEQIALQLSTIEGRDVSATSVRRALRDWDEAESAASAARASVPGRLLRRLWCRPSRAVEGGA